MESSDCLSSLQMLKNLTSRLRDKLRVLVARVVQFVVLPNCVVSGRRFVALNALVVFASMPSAQVVAQQPDICGEHFTKGIRRVCLILERAANPVQNFVDFRPLVAAQCEAVSDQRPNKDAAQSSDDRRCNAVVQCLVALVIGTIIGLPCGYCNFRRSGKPRTAKTIPSSGLSVSQGSRTKSGVSP